MAANFVAYLAIFTFTAAFSGALASDPDLLQDVCVALPSSSGMNRTVHTLFYSMYTLAIINILRIYS